MRHVAKGLGARPIGYKAFLMGHLPTGAGTAEASPFELWQPLILESHDPEFL
jgi:hypothetical protein